MKKSGKLKLGRETLRTLGRLELELVASGRMPDGSDRDNCGPSTPYVGCTL